jgi:hypothetical protein
LASVEARREKRREIAFKTMTLQQQYEEKDKELTHQENLLMSEERKAESQGLTIVQL